MLFHYYWYVNSTARIANQYNCGIFVLLLLRAVLRFESSLVVFAVRFLPKKLLVIFLFAGLVTSPFNQTALAQTKVRSVPFAYVPDKSADAYNERLPHKTIALADGTLLLLTRRTATEYAVERYAGGDLKKLWSSAITLAEGETIDAFAAGEQSATLLTYRNLPSESAQALYGFSIDLSSGKRGERQQLLKTPQGRRLGTAVSADGSKLVAYEYKLKRSQIRAVAATVYDASFKKLVEQTYDFSAIGSTLSVTVRVTNDGDQYVGLITDDGSKLTVRRYPLKGTEAQVLGVPIGGMFNGHRVYIFDTAYLLNQDQSLYAAAICLDEQTGDYYSLKVVKYDFAANDMHFTDEIRFDAKYQENVAAAAKAAKMPVPERLSDVYLTDVLLTAEKQLIVVAERKFEEGPDAPHLAQDVHLFGYNEFATPSWQAILFKQQQAPPEEGYTGISYSAHLTGSTLHVLTLETINKKTDLYDHAFSALTGKTQPVKALGLNVASGQPVSYLKDFTAWLDNRTILAVSRPAKKSTTLNLNRITLK